MSFPQAFRLALKSLLTSKMRSLLTMLGIIIGVAAVIVITSLGNGMQQMMNDQFDRLGANRIQVQLMAPEDSRSVRPEDMYALVAKYPQYMDGVSPYVNGQGEVRCGGEEAGRTRIYGVSEAFYDPLRNLTIDGGALGAGRFLQYVDVERRQKVCVVGKYLENVFFQGSALGKTVSVSGSPYTVVGVLAPVADLTQGSGDDVLYLPYGCLLQRSGASQVSSYLFTAANQDTSAVAKGLIETRLYRAFQSSDSYFVLTSAEMMDAMNTMMDTMMVVLVAIAAISLLVGGIGIMNIMLVSVTERTREIGIRKSLGAKGKDIRGQFIIEAGVTSAIGGILGILAGVGLAQVAGSLIAGMMTSDMSSATFSAVPALSSVLIAFGVSVGIGVLFGYLPANKAAALNPIDALRYD